MVRVFQGVGETFVRIKYAVLIVVIIVCAFELLDIFGWFLERYVEGKEEFRGARVLLGAGGVAAAILFALGLFMVCFTCFGLCFYLQEVITENIQRSGWVHTLAAVGVIAGIIVGSPFVLISVGQYCIIAEDCPRCNRFEYFCVGTMVCIVTTIVVVCIGWSLYTLATWTIWVFRPAWHDASALLRSYKRTNTECEDVPV